MHRMHRTAQTMLGILLLSANVQFVVSKSDPTCKNGIISGKICCHKSCKTCGGSCLRGCNPQQVECWLSWLESRRCCSKAIVSSNRKCSKTVAPCYLGSFEPPLYTNYKTQEDYIPILGYHKIGGPPSKYRTSIKRFNDQVRYLTDVAGCNWITMDKLSEFITRREKLPTKACVMTFDDGISTQYHNALCTLNKFKVPATYYIITSRAGKKSYYMNWDEIEKLHQIGHDIAPHTRNHAHLSKLNLNQQKREILGSKRDLEKKGYRVRTFAYPYGEYNKDTFTILRSSDFVLARDTKQDYSWKNPKAITINQNPDYLLHFYYIRPELEDGDELWRRIKYNGWWQFEDNYKIVRGTKRTVQLRSSSGYLPTSTSYGIVKMTKRRDEISTQFITKRDGSFTIYIVACNKTALPAFKVKIDGVQFAVHASSEVYYARLGRYYSFYVNIKTLSRGVHLLNIINGAYKTLFLDKFSVYSNVSQDFTEPVHYKNCDPELDDYCQCF